MQENGIVWSANVPLPGQGGAWSQLEEAFLYSLTAAGLKVSEIAERHMRTAAAIKSRQVKLGLREFRAGPLIKPLPIFEPTADLLEPEGPKPRRASVRRDSTSETRKESRKPSGTNAIEAPPELELDRFEPSGNSTIDKIWEALRFDIKNYLAKLECHENYLRDRHIIVERLQPSPEEKVQRTLESLAKIYDLSCERVRQIQSKATRWLSMMPTKAPRKLHIVLEDLADQASDSSQMQLVWIGHELLNAGTTNGFNEVVVKVFGKVTSQSPEALENVLAHLSSNQPTRQQFLSRRSKLRLERQKEARETANLLVEQVLQKAVFGGVSASHEPSLSHYVPLRSCSGNRSAYVKSLNRLVGFESLSEKKLIKALDKCDVISEFAEQAIQIPYYYQNVRRNYFPDLVVRTVEGLLFVIEVKARPQLTDDMVQAKSAAAVEYLGHMGIGYCLVDHTGFSVQDIWNIEPSEDLASFVHDQLRRRGLLRFSQVKEFSARTDITSVMDQLQALVLRDQLHYVTKLVADPIEPNRYHFDFVLRAL